MYNEDRTFVQSDQSLQLTTNYFQSKANLYLNPACLLKLVLQDIHVVNYSCLSSRDYNVKNLDLLISVNGTCLTVGKIFLFG